MNYLEKMECILGWLRLIKILQLKITLEGNSVKMLDSNGKALIMIACFSRIPRLCDIESTSTLR